MLQTKWENRFDDRMVGQCCFISLDNMDFHIQEPSTFDPMWYSHRFEGPGVQYKVGICLQTGWIVWWNGVYPDLNIVRQWLIHELNDEIEKVVLADGGYNDGGEYFMTPSG